MQTEFIYLASPVRNIPSWDRPMFRRSLLLAQSALLARDIPSYVPFHVGTDVEPYLGQRPHRWWMDTFCAPFISKACAMICYLPQYHCPSEGMAEERIYFAERNRPVFIWHEHEPMPEEIVTFYRNILSSTYYLCLLCGATGRSPVHVKHTCEGTVQTLFQTSASGVTHFPIRHFFPLDQGGGFRDTP